MEPRSPKPTPNPTDRTRPEAEPEAHESTRSRRHLLGLLGLGASAAVAHTITRSEPAGATSGTMYFGSVNASGTSTTHLAGYPSGPILNLVNTGSGNGLDVATSGNGISLRTYKQGVGIALSVESTSGTNTSAAARIVNKGNSRALDIYAQHTTSTQAACYARHLGPGPAIAGNSSLGAGGRFAGKTAQVQLVPNAGATTHPANGETGDLFVDKNKRLWFCKGGATWVQLA